MPTRALRRLAPLASVALAGVAALGVPGCSSSRLASRPVAATFPTAAVAADHAVASDAGAEMLRLGGNAVDAAVATSFALSVVRPASCGIGGGGFMVVHLSDAGARRLEALGRPPARRQIAINYREQAPRAADPAFFERAADPDASTFGGAAVAVPGTVAGLLHALERYGTLDRATVLAPAIRAAEEGFVADEHDARNARELARRFERDPAWKDRFPFVWERFLRRGALRPGDVVRLPEQADALRLVARDGLAAFQRGPIADAVVRAARDSGGVLTHEDLAAFRVDETDPLRFTAFDRTFLTMPPPSSGGVAMAQTLGILERVWLRAQASEEGVARGPGNAVGRAVVGGLDAITLQGRRRPTVWATHALAESFKDAFADRARWLADPAFVDVPTARFVSPVYWDARAAAFDALRTRRPEDYGTPDPAAATQPPPDAGTSHLSVVDADGSAVACTETINLVFGSLVAVPEFGFVLNNQMDDFTTRRGQPNAFGLVQSDRNLPDWNDAVGGKRPLSSMTPTIALDREGRVEAVAGASGGPRIITGTTQALLNALVGRDHAGEAVARPRLHHQWSPDVLGLEPWSDRSRLQDALWEDTFRKALEAKGHRVQTMDQVGNVQLIVRDPSSGWQAASDPRKGGRPAGR